MIHIILLSKCDEQFVKITELLLVWLIVQQNKEI